MASQSSPTLPHFQLLCMEEHFGDAFEAARKKYELPSSVTVSIHNYALSQLPPDVKYDTVVSPANSYGRLDGAFDDAISRAFSPRDDYLALTRVAQATLYRKYRGFAPPGSCTLVRFPDEFESRSKNVWGTKRVALCPTMRIPSDATWDREVVYECIWTLLCAIDNHNQDEAVSEGEKIKCVLMPPMATGIGGVSAEKWASQTVLAIKHFIEACEKPEVWGGLEPGEIMRCAIEVEKTWLPEDA